MREDIIIRTQFPDKNPTLLFGPCSTTLFNLYNEGYELEIRFSVYKARANIGRRPLWLVKDNVRYTLGKFRYQNITPFDTPNLVDLSQFVKDNTQCLAPIITSPVVNLFDKLKEMYPVSQKELMVGNQTSSEYIRTQLEISRGLKL